MSAALTRRRALAGSALAALGLGVGRAEAADKAAPISSEARALQEEAGRLSREYRVAAREADAAGQAVLYPDPPEAIYAQPNDYRLFTRMPSPSWSDRAEGRHWWADLDTVEGLRGDSFRYLSGRDCPLAYARRDEIVAAFDAWAAADRAAEDAAGFTAAEDRFGVAHVAYAEFRLRLAEMRTEDLEILIVKGIVIADLCGRSAERLDVLLSRAVERDSGVHEGALALSMARDFIGLFGASAWRQADA